MNPSADIADAIDASLIPRSRRSSEVGNGNPLQHSCWKIPWTKDPGRLHPQGHRELNATQYSTAAAAAVSSSHVPCLSIRFHGVQMEYVKQYKKYLTSLASSYFL